MNSQLFFFLNLLFGVAFVVWFLSSRKEGGGRPTKLSLKKEDKGPEAEPTTRSPAAQGTGPTPAPHPTEVRDAGREEREARIQKAKPLNILFIYNGHDWDAYEVLGLPAGASLPLVTERYQQLIRNADKGQLEFYEAAYQAILKKF